MPATDTDTDTDTLYAAYPSALVFEAGAAGDGEPPEKLSALKHILWGDTLLVSGRSGDGQFLRVSVRGVTGWIRAADTMPTPLLEIVFVDIGQGDGALVVTPQGKRYVIDAGQGDNMFRFLRWRFDHFKDDTFFDAAIISHSDKDHYGGFSYLFKEPRLRFGTVYTNGLMERVAARASDSLGPVRAAGERRYITDLVTSKEELAAFVDDPAKVGNKTYPTMLGEALRANKFDDYRMLGMAQRHMPGHGEDDALTIDVLGPCTEAFEGESALRWFGDVGRTKNGHSVVLRFRLGKVRLFMGGDLNIESSRLLLEAHTGLPGNPPTPLGAASLVEAARPFFESDVAKACHHGSGDTLLPLIKAINPIATVISSGDDEPYAHPRADALGALAKYSRGERPLILSTELARSGKETIKHPAVLRAHIQELNAIMSADDSSDSQKAAAKKKFDTIIGQLDRSVAVYGAINLRTDGEKIILAYKLERSTASRGWDIYHIEPDPVTGKLAYTSKFD